MTTNNVHPFPAVKPGFRLVPAKVGHSNDTSVIAYIECPNWCTEDHVKESVVDIADVMHRGDAATVSVLTGIEHQLRKVTHQLFAYLESDPVAPRGNLMNSVHIAVEDGGNEYAFMTPEMAESLADEMIGFASDLRHQARTARLANQTNGDSDPDMGEALCRVREGGVA